MSEMEPTKCKLGDCFELQRGYDLTSSEMKKGNVIVAGSNGIIGFHDTAKGNSPCITVGRSGSIGKVHYYEQPVWAHNTALFVKDFKGNNPKYLYYFLKNLHLDNFFTSESSVVPSLDRKVVHALEIPFHKDKNHQEKIASFLSILDDKIALNRAINSNLEELAKQIYDYWFVQFDFPNENGRPYKSSGGPMEWCKELNREIPSHYYVEQIGNHTQVLLGGTPDTQNEGYWGGNFPWLNSGEVAEFPIISSEKTITEEGLNSSATVYAPKGCVTLSITRHLRPSILAIDACINQSVVAIKETEKISKEYLYPFIGRDIPRLMSLRTGAQQPHINKEIVDSTWIVIPDDKTLEKYYSITKPIYENIIKNAFEIASLIKMRDNLLPLLMNGQVIIE